LLSIGGRCNLYTVRSIQLVENAHDERNAFRKARPGGSCSRGHGRFRGGFAVGDDDRLTCDAGSRSEAQRSGALCGHRSDSARRLYHRAADVALSATRDRIVRLPCLLTRHPVVECRRIVESSNRHRVSAYAAPSRHFSEAIHPSFTHSLPEHGFISVKITSTGGDQLYTDVSPML
jgi:hypothetical protein